MGGAISGRPEKRRYPKRNRFTLTLALAATLALAVGCSDTGKPSAPTAPPATPRLSPGDSKDNPLVVVRDSFRFLVWAEPDGSGSWVGYWAGRKMVEGHGKGKNAVVKMWWTGVEQVYTIVDGVVVNPPKTKMGGAGVRLGGATVLEESGGPCDSYYWTAVGATIAYEAAVAAAWFICGTLNVAGCYAAGAAATAAFSAMTIALMNYDRCMSAGGPGTDKPHLPT